MGGTITTLIFDLDGVIVDTAKYHFKAWKKLANSLGIDFSEEENEQLKGVSRRGSIDKILTWGNLELTEERIEELMHQKNQWYLEYMGNMDASEILPGVVSILNQAKAKKMKIALGSASKNAPLILDKVNLTHYFDAIIDGNVVTTSKPDPEVFVKGAEDTQSKAEECIVFEDSLAGVEAAINGKMIAVGIGHPQTLKQAHLNLQGFDQIDLEKDILEKI
ncbi:MAG: beta-phosphoglucomutase [Schleiferiaceae bacterium]|jgi:beta-phosphoglucomutase|nr:beta-phosphoglucomutase [Schleiferiaceae bacterium]